MTSSCLPKAPPLAKSQTDILKKWIEEGAPWPEDVELTSVPRMKFEKHIQPIFELNCITCHNPDSKKSEFDMTTLAAVHETLEVALIPFKPEESEILVTMTLPEDDDDLMPPTKQGGPLPKKDIDMVRMWIEQGAIWPEDLKLKARSAKETGRPPSPDSLALVEKIRTHILETSKITEQGAMKAYSSKVPRTNADYHMVPIKGGEFTMGSPDDEDERRNDEGPQVKVTIEPFWMGKYEVTWDQYDVWNEEMDQLRRKMMSLTQTPRDLAVDGFTKPTEPYTDMSFGMGRGDFPAICMTQHAARTFCSWLSVKTGRYYRLPTEAEWEYACRAGTSTAYSFGDDLDELEDYAWFFDNSEDTYHEVGEKEPNAWGLHDMHGNVMPSGYLRPVRPRLLRLCTGSSRQSSARTHHHVSIRGSLPAAEAGTTTQRCCAAPRVPVPQRGLEGARPTDFRASIWYHTDAPWLGFRLIRPLKVPSAEEMYHYWTSGVAGTDE